MLASSQADLNIIIHEFEITDDPNYAKYNCSSKVEEQRGVTKLTPVIYNESFVRFAIEELQKIWTVSIMISTLNPHIH